MSEQKNTVGVCAILLNTQGEVLVGKRKNSYKAGFFGLPGGRVELHESVRDAIRREVLEETGIDAAQLEYVGAVRENQGECDYTHFVFVQKDIVTQPVLCEPDKCEGWQWLNPQQPFENSVKGHKAALQLYFEKKHLLEVMV